MTTRTSRLERALLGLLIACTLASLAGYATFGLHPALMGSDAGVARTYALAIIGFPRLHILLGFVALAAMLSRGAAGRWLPSALAIYVVSLGSELLGTSIGKPFGPYRYTDALGVKWFGLVPVLIPLSWLTMSVASFALARRTLGVRRPLTAICAGAALLVAWDLSLDPAMSRLTPYWVWGVSGPYFGMPLLNLTGWALTGVVLQAILVGLRADEWIDDLAPQTVRAIVAVYVANLALPVGMTFAAGLPLAGLASLAAVGLIALLAYAGRIADQPAVRRTGRAEVAR